MLYYFVFLNLAIQGMKYNPSSQKRTVFYRTRNLIFQPMLLGASNFLLVSLLLPLPAWLSAVRQWHLFCSILPAVACIFYLSHLHYFRPSGKRYQKIWDPPKYITHQKQNRKWKIFQVEAISVSDIEKETRTNPKNAIPSGNIPPKILKLSSDTTATALQELFNESL